MDSQPQVLVFTHIPSPYQVELFNKVFERQEIDLQIAYLHSLANSNRNWRETSLHHKHILLDDNPEIYRKVESLVNSSALVVFCYYQHPAIISLINQRNNSGKPWCFWGERLGYHNLGLIGTIYHRYKLKALHQSQSSIWGIGKWAVKQYQGEFGENRKYFNIPYFSDLDRFHIDRKVPVTSDYRKFLFSGSLIRRKGVDLLAKSFNKLADEFPHVHLSLLGNGNLRSMLEKQLDRHRERVEFLGFQNWEDLPRFYRQADILCVPSRYDGWALVVPEGLASGLPTIATDRTGAAIDLINHGKNGWLIPASDSDALYQAMRSAAMLSDDDLLAFSNAAIQSVANHTLDHGVSLFLHGVSESLNFLN